jgi:hypothetical protein
MILRRQTSAFAVLGAACAIVLQAVLLTICDALAERQAFVVSSLCTPSQSGERRPAPAGHRVERFSACLACSCGMAATPEPGVAHLDLRGMVQRIAARTLVAAAAPLHADWAHRSRGPPFV